MADAKITALTDLGTSVATTDILPVVDSTDTTTKKITIANLLGLVYPIGCIYTEITGTNPNTTFGFGTWAAFGAGKVLVGLDSGNTAFDTVEETGGVETVTLTSAQSGLPAHGHLIRTGDNGYNVGFSGDADGGGANGMKRNASSEIIAAINNTAANAASAHTNLQPYIVVYFWKRTA